MHLPSLLRTVAATLAVGACTSPLTTDDPVLGAWYRYCEVTSGLDGCEQSVSNENICKLIGQHKRDELDAACREPARLYWTCVADLSWACGTDDHDPATYDEPVADLSACADELAAMQGC